MRPFLMSKKMKEKHQRWQELGLVADPPQTWEDWERLCRQGGALTRRMLEEYRPDDENARRRREVAKKKRIRDVQNLNMHFTPSRFPRYAIRLDSGELAQCPVVDTQDNAAVYFLTREMAIDWLQTECLDEKAQVVELDFDTWWLTLLEPPYLKFMAFALDRGPAGMAILEVYHAIRAHVELAKDGKELSAADFAAISDAERAALYTAIKAEALYQSGDRAMKKISEAEIRELVKEFDEHAPPVEELGGYERADAWIEWLKVRLGCPTVEQLEVRLGMKILE